jgi:hypothetical protein
LPDAIAKAATNQTAVNASTITVDTGWGDPTTVSVAFKKDKNNADATVISYTSYSVLNTVIVGSYINKPNTFLSCSKMGNSDP